MAPPVLVTRRLTLAGPEPADLADAAEMWTDPAVYGLIAGEPITREETWARLLRYVGHWQALGCGTWYLRETTTGRFAGEVGLMDFRRTTRAIHDKRIAQLAPHRDEELRSAAQKRGFA